MSQVVHPDHYGGDVPEEPIKVIRKWGLNFALGNAVKYIARAGKKGSKTEDLSKAIFYIEDEIERGERSSRIRMVPISEYQISTIERGLEHASHDDVRDAEVALARVKEGLE